MRGAGSYLNDCTIHSDFALGSDLARRYPATIAPMAGVREISTRFTKSSVLILNVD
jgi:hypothetical protein